MSPPVHSLSPILFQLPPQVDPCPLHRPGISRCTPCPLFCSCYQVNPCPLHRLGISRCSPCLLFCSSYLPRWTLVLYTDQVYLDVLPVPYSVELPPHVDPCPLHRQGISRWTYCLLFRYQVNPCPLHRQGISRCTYSLLFS